MSKLRSAGRHSTKDIPQKIRSFTDLVLLTKSLTVRFVVFCVGVLLMLAAVPATAQEVSTAPVEASDERLESEAFVAPVVVDGQELFVVRGSSALPANERAETIQDRIIAIAAASDKPTVSVEILNNEFGLEIEVNGRMATITTVGDAEYEQTELDLLASLQAEAIEAAILTYREGRSDSARVGSALAAVAWTLAFIAMSVVFIRKRNILVTFVVGLVENRFETVEEATKSLVRGKAIAAILGYGVNVLLWIGFLVLFYYYVSFVLLAFAETRTFADLLLNNVSAPMIDIAIGFVDYLPSLITLVIIAALTRYVLQGVKLFFDNLEKGVFQIGEFEQHWISPTFFLTRIFVILIALVFAYPYIPGSGSRAFQGLTILAGLMLSLGSNTVISNMMSGLLLIYRRSMNVGDRIQVGDKIGDVVEIKLMETLIKSIKNELVSIPNAQLLNSEVVNFTRKVDGRGLVVHTTVGIGYEEPPKKVKAMLIEAAHRTQGLKKSPEPFVLWTQLADYAINYEINAYSSRGASLPRMMSDLHENIVEVFNENSTQIMTPSYMADPEVPKIPTQHWDGVLAGDVSNTTETNEKGEIA
jgi:small-conductance mechanosensitive channel